MPLKNDVISFSLGFFSGLSKKMLSNPTLPRKDELWPLLISSPAFILALAKGYQDGTLSQSFFIATLGLQTGELTGSAIKILYGPEMIHGEHRNYRRLQFGK